MQDTLQSILSYIVISCTSVGQCHVLHSHALYVRPSLSFLPFSVDFVETRHFAAFVQLPKMLSAVVIDAAEERVQLEM